MTSQGRGGSALVVGAGLIGCSIGLALREAGWQVRVEDSTEELTYRAVRLTGLEAMESGFQPEVVVVSVPPGVAAQVIIEALRLYPDATVMDTASVKADIAHEVYTNSIQSDRYVPSHPMAGKESTGPADAAYDLFLDRLWVYAPRGEARPQSLAAVAEVISACGAIAVGMGPEEHDATVALTSHLPQVLASALAGLLAQEEESHVAVSGQGLRDMTRIAGSNPRLWSEILLANREHVRERLGQVAEAVAGFDAALAAGDAAQLEERLRLGNEGKRRIPGKHGAAAQAWQSVAIMIEDSPGQLARIFACAGRLGVNIEDVRIDHALGRAAAVIELDVDPKAAAQLAAGLASEGWTLRNVADFD